MPIKTKEDKTDIPTRVLVCEDSIQYKDVKGRVGIMFAQKELLDLLDNRIAELKRNLKELDIEKITARRRQIAKTKLFGRISEAENIRKLIIKSTTFRKDSKYWKNVV